MRARGAAGIAAGVGAVLLVAVLARGEGGAPPLRVGAEVELSAAAGNPTATLAPDGRAWIAWVETGEGGGDVRAAPLAEDGSAGAAVAVNDIPGDATAHEQAPARIAAGPEGHLYVAWTRAIPVEGRRFPASDLRFARSVDGGRSFEPALTVNDDVGGVPASHTFHDLAVGADGTVWVSWIDSRERDAARKGGGGMAEEDLPPLDVRVARSTDGGRTFEPGRVVDAAPCPCCRTALVPDGAGGLWVAWRKEYPGSVRDIVVARLDPGADTFSPPVRVHADAWHFPACPHAGPALAVDGRGRLHVGWYTGQEGRQGLWLARSDDGGRTFGAPSPLRVGTDVPPSIVALATVGGEVVAAWDDRTAEGPRVAVGTVSESGSVPRPEDVGAGRLPAFAASPGGAVLAWHAGDGVRARRLAAGETPR